MNIGIIFEFSFLIMLSSERFYRFIMNLNAEKKTCKQPPKKRIIWTDKQTDFDRNWSKF